MKIFFCFVLLAVTINFSVAGETVEVDIHGMTSTFCSDGLQRSLSKLPEVESAEVSLKLRKVRLMVDSENYNVEKIKQAIVDSGFTPVEVRVVPNAE